MGNVYTIHRKNMQKIEVKPVYHKHYDLIKYFYLQMETDRSLHYWKFTHRIDAQIALSKINNCEYILCTDLHHFSTVRIYGFKFEQCIYREQIKILEISNVTEAEVYPILFYILRLETNQTLHYWKFNKSMDAEVAYNKMNKCKYILCKGSHNFNSVTIVYE